MKRELNIAGRKVTVDAESLSKGLCELHNECEDKKTMLAFGMLDHELCELFRKQLDASIRKEFSAEANDLFKSRINDFIKDVSGEVEKGVYSYASMVV